MNESTTSLGLLLAAILAAGCEKPEFQPPPPPPVVVAEPIVRDVTVYQILSGRTEPVETVEVRARVEGVLLEIAHAEGLPVKEGTLMFRIDPEPFEAARDAAAAQVTSAEARAELTDITAGKLEDAYKHKAVSELQALEARAKNKVAVEDVKVATKNLAIRELDVTYTRVVAPISGRVAKSDFFVGSLVGGFSSSALTHIIDDSRIRAWFTLPDRIALKLIDQRGYLGGDGEDASDTEISVELAREIDGDEFPFTGVVDYADPEVDIDTGTLRVRAVFDNAHRRLSGGLFVRVRLQAGSLEGALVIPEVALGRDQQGQYIFVVGNGNIVERRAVKLGPRVDGGIVVVEGLAAGERVVIAGQLSARPGAEVTPRTSDSTAGASAGPSGGPSGN